MFTLFSQYDCLVIFNGKEVTLEENESLIIEQPCKVLVYPIGKAKAFSFSIDLAKLSDSVFYKFKKVEKRFYVFLLEFSRKHSQDVYNFSTSGFSCQVFIAKDSLCFLSQSQKINLELPFQIEKYSCKKPFLILSLSVCNSSVMREFEFLLIRHFDDIAVFVFRRNNFKFLQCFQCRIIQIFSFFW